MVVGSLYQEYVDCVNSMYLEDVDLKFILKFGDMVRLFKPGYARSYGSAELAFLKYIRFAYPLEDCHYKKLLRELAFHKQDFTIITKWSPLRYRRMDKIAELKYLRSNRVSCYNDLFSTFLENILAVFNVVDYYHKEYFKEYHYKSVCNGYIKHVSISRTCNFIVAYQRSGDFDLLYDSFFQDSLINSIKDRWFLLQLLAESLKDCGFIDDFRKEEFLINASYKCYKNGYSHSTFYTNQYMVRIDVKKLLYRLDCIDSILREKSKKLIKLISKVIRGKVKKKRNTDITIGKNLKSIHNLLVGIREASQTYLGAKTTATISDDYDKSSFDFNNKGSLPITFSLYDCYGDEVFLTEDLGSIGIAFKKGIAPNIKAIKEKVLLEIELEKLSSNYLSSNMKEGILLNLEEKYKPQN